MQRGGALISALWTAGFNLTTMQKQVYSLFGRNPAPQVDPKTLLDMADNKPGHFNMEMGLYHPVRLKKALEGIFMDTPIEGLKPRTMLYATDMSNGEGVLLENGRLSEAILASSSLSPVMPPVHYHGRLLADGLFSSPLPVLEAVKQNMDIIVAVFFEDRINPKPENFLESFLNMSRMSSEALIHSQMAMAIDLHHYEIFLIKIPFPHPLPFWETNSMPEIFRAGKQAAKENMRPVLDCIARYGLD